MNRKNSGIILLALLITWIGLIFYFSSQPSAASYKQSGLVIKGMNKIDEIFDITHTPVYKKLVYLVRDRLFGGRYKSTSALVRKSAHFGIYFVLGIMCSVFAYHYSKKFLMGFLLGISLPMVIAVLDEYNQSFVGRTSSLSDVLLDGAGALLGTIIALVMLAIISLIKHIRQKG